MNKIIVVDNKIKLDIDDSIEVVSLDSTELFNVKKVIIKIIKDTNLEIEYSSKESKIDIEFVISDYVNCHVFELRHDEKLKAQYHYIVGENSSLNIVKFYDCKETKELDIVKLNGEYANVDYKLKTIATQNQKYDLVIYHNFKNTSSNITNHGINLDDGSITFNVTGLVYNDMTDCELNQNNKIVTFNDNKCVITPKLLIDENDVVANHSALIGKFEDDEIFYLQSRGIDKDSAIKLLVKGFLLENLEDERLEKILEKYWG